MGDVAPGKRLRASARSWIAAHRSAGGDCSRGRLALVKPGLPATAFGGKGLTRASALAPAPPCVRRQSGAGSPISTHSDFKRGLLRDRRTLGISCRLGIRLVQNPGWKGSLLEDV